MLINVTTNVLIHIVSSLEDIHHKDWETTNIELQSVKGNWEDKHKMVAWRSPTYDPEYSKLLEKNNTKYAAWTVLYDLYETIKNTYNNIVSYSLEFKSTKTKYQFIDYFGTLDDYLIQKLKNY